MKYDFFISYSRKDTAVVDEFVNRFQREGFHFWIDRDGVESGDAFKRVIVNAIKESAMVLFFSSQTSNSSPWTTKEISVAVHYGKPIIPIRIDKSFYNEEVEFDLVNLDYVDYTDPELRQPMMEKLVRTIKSKLPPRLDECVGGLDNGAPQHHAVNDNIQHLSAMSPMGVQPNLKKEEVVSASQPPKKKKTLWVVLGIVVLLALAALVLKLMGPNDKKQELTTTNHEDLTITANGVAFVMKPIEGESFVMGGTDDAPAHDETVNTFYMGETEVTQALWKAVMGSEPTHNGGWTVESGLGDNYPAYGISWNDIQKFMNKLNALTDKKFRLPTEVEWEFAARGGKKANGYLYAGSPRIEEVAWYNRNSGNITHEVKQLKPNELGLYDMSGNVWEWCVDLYDENANDATMRVLRGGGWNRNADRCQVTFRGKGGPDFRGSSHGFRLAL
jgi:formylglycine-generating enzyme required for sulfatase activity